MSYYKCSDSAAPFTLPRCDGIRWRRAERVCLCHVCHTTRLTGTRPWEGAGRICPVRVAMAVENQGDPPPPTGIERSHMSDHRPAASTCDVGADFISKNLDCVKSMCLTLSHSHASLHRQALSYSLQQPCVSHVCGNNAFILHFV